MVTIKSPQYANTFANFDVLRMNIEKYQLQLSTGQKYQTYTEMGLNRRQILGVNNEISKIKSYISVSKEVATRLNLLENGLERVSDISHKMASLLRDNGYSSTDVKVASLSTSAKTYLSELTHIMNSDYLGRHLYSGRKTETPPVVPIDTMFNGDPLDSNKAGLKQIIAERIEADSGSTKMGRLVSTIAASKVNLAEDAAGHPFGFKIQGVKSSDPSVSISGPKGATNEISVEFTAGAQPAKDAKISVQLSLPDGTFHTIELQASHSENGANTSNKFIVDPTDPAKTAANFKSTLDEVIKSAVTTQLEPVSSLVATESFFFKNGEVPMRVDTSGGPDATSLIAGTDADTVMWYQGDDSTAPPRDLVKAKISDRQHIEYGVLANEKEIVDIFIGIASVSAMELDENMETAGMQITTLSKRVGSLLDDSPDKLSVTSLRSELASTQKIVDESKERQETQIVNLENILSDLINTDDTETALLLKDANNTLQQSYLATSMLMKTSFIQFM